MFHTRAVYWWSILKRVAWRLLVAVPFALGGGFTLVRDEFLTSEQARELKMLQLLPDIGWYWWVIVALVLLLFFALEGAFREFRDQQQLVAQAQSERDAIASTQHPRLEGRCDQVILGENADSKAVEALVLMNLTIRNTGAPSIVDRWRAKIRFNGVELNVRLIVAPTHFQQGSRAISIGREDFVYEKAMHPIPMGGQIRGWLEFGVPGISNETFRLSDPEIEIIFEDVLSRPHSIIEKINGHGPSHELYYYPDGTGGRTIR